MKKHPEIKWDSIAQSALKRYLEKLETTKNITTKSKLTLDDVEEISNEITKKSWEQHKEYLKKLEK
jgi:predicted transcriptional regulator